MNYLHDKKVKKNKYLKWGLGIVAIFIFIFFSTNIINGTTYGLQSILRPLMSLGNNIKEGFAHTSAYFISKKSLQKENEELRAKLAEEEARITSYDVLLAENNKLKEDWGRKTEALQTILATVLARPNQSLYDTLVIDVGANQLVQEGDRVFAKGDIPIGTVREVYPHSAKVVLYTSPGEETQVVVSKILDEEGKEESDAEMTLIGRGGGNFEMVIPRDFELAPLTPVHLPGITPYVVAKVETIISDPRDSVKKALLVSPVNIQEIKFVQVE